MFINGVKVTFIICLTIIVCCVLGISFSEYTNRYTIVPASDNSVYIFDKKSTTLNKCDNAGCQLLETKLPATAQSNITDQISKTPSKLFGENKTMPEEITKVEAAPKQEQNENIKDPEQDKDAETPKETTKDKAENNDDAQEMNRLKNKKQIKTNKPITVKKRNG